MPVNSALASRWVKRRHLPQRSKSFISPLRAALAGADATKHQRVDALATACLRVAPLRIYRSGVSSAAIVERFTTLPYSELLFLGPCIDRRVPAPYDVVEAWAQIAPRRCMTRRPTPPHLPVDFVLDGQQKERYEDRHRGIRKGPFGMI